MIASPRKMCVPGVQAYASPGVSGEREQRDASRHEHDSRAAVSLTAAQSRLDPDPLPLAAHRFAEIVHLVAHYVVDRFARARRRTREPNRRCRRRGRSIDQLFAALTRRAIAALPLARRPSARLRGRGLPPIVRPGAARSPAHRAPSSPASPAQLRAPARVRSITGPIGRRPLGPVRNSSVTAAPTAAPSSAAVSRSNCCSRSSLRVRSRGADARARLLPPRLAFNVSAI